MPRSQADDNANARSYDPASSAEAIESILCIQSIVAELSALYGSPELATKFSKSVQRQLQKIPGQEKTLAFWSLHEKGTGEETERDSGPVQDALWNVNQRYNSIPFLESAGTPLGPEFLRANVFSLKPIGAALEVRAFFKRSEASPQEGIAIETRTATLQCPNPRLPSPDDFVRELRIDEALEANVEDYCDQWGGAFAMLRDLNERNEGWTDDDARAASSHLMLLCLIQLYHRLTSLSYILAPTLKGQPASSMAIFWGKEPSYSVFSLPFQLQMALGQGALRVAAAERLAAASYGLAHSLKHRTGGLHLYTGKLASEPEILSNPRRSRLVKKLQTEVEAVRGFASLAHLMYYAATEVHEVYNAKRGESHRFASSTNYDLLAQFDELCDDLDVEARLSGDARDRDFWMVRPFKRTRDGGRVRLMGDVYQMFLYEILSNVKNHGIEISGPRPRYPVDVRLDSSAAAKPAIIFSNDARQPIDKELKAVDWKVWQGFPRTGLSHVSLTLDLTRCGERLQWRAYEDKERTVWHFELKLVLYGLGSESCGH